MGVGYACRRCPCFVFFVFFFNDTATTEIYTLSLHDALPISPTYLPVLSNRNIREPPCAIVIVAQLIAGVPARSEEHTSELQSRPHLVCRLLLEKKNYPLPPRDDCEYTDNTGIST